MACPKEDVVPTTSETDLFISEVDWFTSGVVSFTSDLNWLTSEIVGATDDFPVFPRAYTLHVVVVFFLHCLHPRRHFSQNLLGWWRISFIHNSLFNKRVVRLVKEVKEKNTFCKGCARVRAKIFALWFHVSRAALFYRKGFPKFSVMICSLLKKFTKQ